MIAREEDKEPCLCAEVKGIDITGTLAGNKVLSPTKGVSRTTSGISSWFAFRNDSIIVQTDSENVGKLVKVDIERSLTYRVFGYSACISAFCVGLFGVAAIMKARRPLVDVKPLLRQITNAAEKNVQK